MHFLVRTKQNPFSPKHRSKSIGQIDISYKDVKIKTILKGGLSWGPSTIKFCLD